MQPTNWYKIFYWLTVADNARSFFTVAVAIFTACFAVSMIGHFIVMVDGPYDETKKQNILTKWRKWIFWSAPFTVFFWLALTLTPSKKDSLLIIAGGGTMQFLTTDSAARQLPHDALEFVSAELRSMAADAKVEIGIQSQKEKILDEAKKMTTEQVLDRMKTDTTFANVVLGK